MTSVLLISPTAVIGGAERALLTLALGLISKGHSVRVIVLEHGPLVEWLDQSSIEVVQVSSRHRTRRLPSTVRTILKLRRLILESDIVINNQTKGHVFGGLAARLAGKPTIWWQHEIPSSSLMERVGSIIRSKWIVCTTPEAKAAQHKLTPRRSIVVVYPGTDIAKVSAHRGSGRLVREHMGWGHRTTVGMIGRLQPWKGQERFLRAIPEILVRHPGTLFVIIGGAILGWEGHYLESLHQLSVELRVEPHVTFVDHQVDVHPWMDAMDIVVNASEKEPFGLVLVEAMALGKVVIAPDSGGPAIIVEHGKTGLLYAPMSDAALASAVTAVLDDVDLATTLERGALRRAADFSDIRMVSAFEALLMEIGLGTGPL